jgi:hypothetical protein
LLVLGRSNYSLSRNRRRRFGKGPEDTQAARAIDSAQDSRQLFTRLSAFADEPMVPGKTVLILNEVQECKNAVTAIKF